MKTAPYITLLFVLSFGLIFGFKKTFTLVGEHFKSSEVYVVSDTLGSGQDQWDIVGGMTPDGKPMLYNEAYRLVQNHGKYTPIPVSRDWKPKNPEK